MSKNQIRKISLKNGLEVKLLETPTETFAGQLRVWHGALHEKTDEAGLAHFLEHTLMTGGSKKHSPEEADDIRNTFGQYNAYTSLDRTVFEVDSIASDIPLFLEYISDQLFNPLFDLNRVNEERQRVLREMSDYKKGFAVSARKALDDAFFGSNSQYVYDILGTPQVIEGAQCSNLASFHSRGYNPSNMDLILVGKIPHNIEDLLNKSFGGYSAGCQNKMLFEKSQPLLAQRVIHLSAPDLLNSDNPQTSNAQVILNIATVSKTHEDYVPLQILAQILGGSANSRLFKAVSQRDGFAYSIGANTEFKYNSGLLSVNGSVMAEQKDKALDSIFREFRQLCEVPVSVGEINAVTSKIKYSFLKGREFNRGYLHEIEWSMDNNLTSENYLQKLETINPEIIQSVAQKYLPVSRTQGNYVLLIRDPLLNK